MRKETEIKIKIDKEIFDRFVKNKLSFKFEKTYGYFTESYENIVKGIFPRIKDIGDIALVSVKVKTKNDSKMFERDEYEFEINSSNVESAKLMFKALGYVIEHIFEKKRYKLESLNNCDFVIDELPFGYFVELEGTEENIEKSIKDIGLENCERINGAYLKLWDKYKQENKLTGECVFNQVESNANGDLLVETLNFEQENIDKVVQKINIPYEYLDIDARANINNIIDQFIKPNLQDALRSKEKPSIFSVSIQGVLDAVTPEKLPVDKFLHDQKEIYVKKINLQYVISKFLAETLRDKDEALSKKEDVIANGLKLYEQSLEVEPVYFGYNSQNKKFIDHCDNKYFEEYEKNKLINDEERLLLLTPSQPSYYLKRELDLNEYKISQKENRKDVKNSLLKLYFNDDEAYFDNYFKNTINKNGDFFIDDKNRRKEIKKNILAVKEQFHNFFVKKQYFLLERKIKYAREVDELLIIDNCFDKYFESKSCFLHDLFLKTYLIKWIDGKNNFSLDNSNMENSIKETLNFDDNKLLDYKNNKNAS